MMTKSSDFIDEFSRLNDQIVEAISEGSFARVIILDKARQDMMQNLCLLASDEVDNKLFDFIDDCSRQNTKMIEDMDAQLDELIHRNNQFKKVVRAYHS